MKLEKLKLRWIVIPSLLILTIIWSGTLFMPAEKAMPVMYYEAMPESVEGEEARAEPIFDAVQVEQMSWQEWVTWIVGIGNGLLAAIVQIKKIRSKNT